MSMGDVVNIIKKCPTDYHCRCEYCKRFIGELRPADKSYYSRLERRKYYDPCESGSGEGKSPHIAKTPLHIARWAVQRYTEPGDWVLDPTAGAGTTAVEAMTQGRCFIGMELQYESIIVANIKKHVELSPKKPILRIGDARQIGDLLKKSKIRPTLVVNNPPYSGDESMPSLNKRNGVETVYKYDRSLPNIAFLRENGAYWETIRSIYGTCVDSLAPGGHFVTGIKDQGRGGKSDDLHKGYCDVLRALGLTPVGTAILLHYPKTLHLNTCFQRHGYHPPYYQTISVFKK
jgi:hypothetical protein